MCSSQSSAMKQMLVAGDTPFLPEEIITNILKRLPVKSLIRFQIVCKHWNNLIKTQSFIADHLHHSTHQNPSLLIQQIRTNPLCLYLLDCHMQFREVEKAPLISSLVCARIIGSSNGLLCLADYRRCPPSPLLWNPAIREVRQLPITTDHFEGECLLGFGFSPIINDYKIVRVYELIVICQVEVYSLSTGSWKDIEFENLGGVSLVSHAVTVNGVMFWYGLSLEMSIGNTYVIVSFDIASEVFRVIPWPASASYSGKLATYENKLATLSHSRIGNSQYSCLYLGVMEEGGTGSSGERWNSSKKYIRSSCPFKLHLGAIWRDQIVCVVFGLPGVSSESEMANDESKVGLYLFNVTTNECKRFAIPGPSFHVDVFNYVESLVPLGNIHIEEH
ncbi:putative F-box protein At1g32420 [Neltuma alba]|uniref:putative F-box protein At1g32420 n=1 Tax=Neltuma alba TaxID=207710 RepID=UPI0010A4757F|nr:putative F-box protein At1g32420 [Prosopis alba]